MTDTVIYRLLLPATWEDFKRERRFEGTEVDHRDGFIHFSTADQLRATAAKHYNSHEALILLAVDAAAVETDLKWEVSRGGALFPHLYARLDFDQVDQDWLLPSDGQGGYVWPDFLL